MSGDYAIVGAPRKDDAGNNSGAAYIFTRQGTAWVEQAKLVAPDARPGDYFGVSVAIDEDTVLVGGHRINKPHRGRRIRLCLRAAWQQLAPNSSSHGSGCY